VVDRRSDLATVSLNIAACTRCALREGCTQPVPGLGDIDVKYMLIGEAPGKREDEAGVPFIGSAGKKLDKLLAKAGIDKNDCYFTNTCRCRPPFEDGKQKKPSKRQIKLCLPYLWAEIELVHPQFIITLGGIPLSIVTDTGITKLHGTMSKVNWNGHDIDTIFMYHPAASLHQPRLEATMLTDWEVLPSRSDPSFTVVEGNIFGT
jgi:uracil-DNA glycosylase family 4